MRPISIVFGAIALTFVGLSPGCQSTKPRSTIDFIEAPALDQVKPWIAEQKNLALAQGKQVLVYVGAPWCEPCEIFHKAASDGALNASFPNLRLLQFDSDRDSIALAAAGYGSEMIPLFAEIAVDGNASGRKIAGSVKGQAAIAEITPRLTSLLAPPK
jgi:thiol-disulfide isomerase/thioredoxin